MRTRRPIERHVIGPCGATRARAKYAPIDEETRRRFWEDYRAAIEALRANPVAWAELMEEDRLFEGTLMDGLGDE